MNAEQLFSYDKYIVTFSGGKDSTACFLYLLEKGIPAEKIELWHHDIDGEGETFMDWEITRSYCEEFAKAFNVPIYFSWRDGGFLRELMRDNETTAGVYFETPEGLEYVAPVMLEKYKSTRLKFPQVSPNLSVRWCSASLKIDVFSRALANQSRFKGLKTLVLSGERAEESAARSKYKKFEPDRTNCKSRQVDRFRPVLKWKEKTVWKLIEKYRVVVHPAYYLGWGRVSCKYCIFGSANQFASAYFISPKQGNQIINLEIQFNTTIKRDIDLKALIQKGKVYNSVTDDLAAVATSKKYNLPIFTNNWKLPAGAFGESCGPT